MNFESGVDSYYNLISITQQTIDQGIDMIFSKGFKFWWYLGFESPAPSPPSIKEKPNAMYTSRLFFLPGVEHV